MSRKVGAIHITHAVVTQVQITPAVSSLLGGLSEQLKGEAILSDGQVMDVTTDDAVSWRSSDPAVATVSSSGPDKGMVTGVSRGTVTITASGEANGQPFSTTAEVRVVSFYDTPSPIRLNWDDAESYCRSLSPTARLPSLEEMQALFILKTSATEAPTNNHNFDMCDVHGWPLVGRCGGDSSDYWTSDTSRDTNNRVRRLAVRMTAGIEAASGGYVGELTAKNYTACLE
ncbi:Ig-like domain-containing protein [Aeromonas caviae]|uniref:Ig-like domain-containing protein n=1 Tax=Aeromonas caviae TaxID=648 RepID=UPI002B49B613|nr:Ig-like domain-containing protein [Aeromonas caviae]